MVEEQMIKIPQREYEELLEEVGILRNSEMIEAIKENEDAKQKGMKTWELAY